MLKQTIITFALFMACLSIGFAQTPLPSSDGASFLEDQQFSKLAQADNTLPELVVVIWYGSESSLRVYQTLNQSGFQPILWPAVFREAWRPAAKLALMANKLALTPQQQSELFQQSQTNTTPLNQAKDFVAMLGQFELDEKQLEDAVYDSELPKRLVSIQNKIKQFSISTVPTIIFKGQYIIDAKQAQTPARLVEIIQYLDNKTP